MSAHITIRRADFGSGQFLISLDGYHYPGEGMPVDQDQLEAMLGRKAAQEAIAQIHTIRAERDALEQEG
jgi:hypothetical protein